jgi:RNA polymerase-binding transcription factor DksA
MANLTQKQLAHLTQLLKERELALRADLRRETELKDDYADVASEAPDPGDSSFANLAIDLDNAALTRDVVELRAIEAARRHIENGTYGQCINCENNIPYGRMEAQPTAERCAPCQELYEKTHGDALRGSSM